jgi:galactan 5-O-arabinofuranosyltransferase
MSSNYDNPAVSADEPADTMRCPLPSRKRALVFAGEVLATVVVASLVSALVQMVVNRLPIERQSNEPRAVSWAVVFVVSCAMIALLWKRWSRLSTVAAWILPAILTSTVQALQLFGTPFYLFGTNGDQFFRMQYLQRLTVSPWPADDNYSGLPPFYPAGWFWLGGRFAAIVGNPAWVAYKPFAILSIAVTASLSFVLWSLVVSRRKAFCIGAALAMAGTVIGTYEPYSWFAIVLVPPLAVLAWRLFDAVVDRRAPTALGPATVLIGVGISIAAATYTLVFGFAVLLVVAIAVAAVLARTRKSSSAGDGASVRGLVLAAAVRLVLIGVAALPITVLTWGPYVLAALRLPTARNAAAQFFSVGMATLDTPMLRPSLTGVICMTGLIWIVLAWPRNSVARALGGTVLVCVGWQLLSTLALAADTTLLPLRIAKVGEAVLWCACALAMIDLTTGLSDRVRIGSRRSAGILVSVLAVLVTVELAQAPSRGTQNLIDGAFVSYDAEGRAPAHAPGPSPGRFNKRLIEAVADMTGRRPQDNIVLTNNYQLLVFQPYHGFQMNKEQYANPLALYPDRNRELTRWSASRTPEELAAGLRSSRFETPNVFIFRRDHNGDYPFRIVTTEFPKDNASHTITFHSRLFDSPDFDSREIGPFTVIVRT